MVSSRSSSVLDPSLVERVAAALGADEGLIEKDWHAVRALRVIASLGKDGPVPVFSGGTSLNKGWALIQRFSEDLDFKVAPRTGRRAERRAFRNRVLNALAEAGFELVGQPLVLNESRTFKANFAYGGQFGTAAGRRPHLRIEMTFEASALPPVPRPLQSLIGSAQRAAPEIGDFPCLDPIETAADKMSALAWHILSWTSGSDEDDPAVIRHLHDLAALERLIVSSPLFYDLVRRAVAGDADRGGEAVPPGVERFPALLRRLEAETMWMRVYEDWVDSVSFAPAEGRIGFAAALESCRRLIAGL